MLDQPAIWFPTIRTGTGTDVFTERLVAGLRQHGLRAEITWLTLRAEYAPWSVPVPQPPAWANIAHVNTWLHTCFLPHHLPIVATLHHAVHHPDAQAYKGWLRAAYHRHWIVPNERCVLHRASHVVAVSQFVADTARQTLADVPMQVIYNGVDTETFRPGTRQRAVGAPFRLLYVGSWMARKGVDLLAPVLRELGPSFELHYTGGPAAAPDKARMPPNMYDIGRLQDADAVIAAMQGADALLFPSRSEGFGLVVAEAMACGLPVIGTQGTPVEEILCHGHTGLLRPPNDVPALAAAVRTLATDPALCHSLARAALVDVAERFSESAMLDAYLAIYRALSAQDAHPTL